MEMELLCQILAEVLHVDCREVTPEMTLEGDLDADSLDLYQILQKAEERFGIAISEQKMMRVQTVRDILVMIRRERTRAEHEA